MCAGAVGTRAAAATVAVGAVGPVAGLVFLVCAVGAPAAGHLVVGRRHLSAAACAGAARGAVVHVALLHVPLSEALLLVAGGGVAAGAHVPVVVCVCLVQVLVFVREERVGGRLAGRRAGGVEGKTGVCGVALEPLLLLLAHLVAGPVVELRISAVGAVGRGYRSAGRRRRRAVATAHAEGVSGGEGSP